MEERQLLQQIDELHQWLLQEPRGRILYGQVQDPDGITFANKAEKLLNLVQQLKDEHNPDYINILPQQIGSLRNRNISEVRISYNIANEPKATKGAKQSFIQSLTNANEALGRHLHTLFEHINQVRSTF